MNAFAVFERVLATVIPVFLIALVGFAYARHKANVSIDAMNVIMLDILAPLLVFTSLADKGFDLYAQRWVIVGGVLVVIGSGLVAYPIARWRGWDINAFVPPAMFNNCGNMGLPLAVFAYGQTGLAAAIALFTSSNLLHFTMGVKMLSPAANIKQVLKTPLTMGMILGLIANALNAYTGVHMPAPLQDGLSMLGKAAIPLMLFMLGVRMAQSKLDHIGAGLACGVVSSAAGLFTAWIVHFFIPLSPAEYAYVLLFASLPPAVLNVLMATQYKADVPATTSAVVWGHVVSLVAVPIAVAWGVLESGL